MNVERNINKKVVTVGFMRRDMLGDNFEEETRYEMRRLADEIGSEITDRQLEDITSLKIILTETLWKETDTQEPVLMFFFTAWKNSFTREVSAHEISFCCKYSDIVAANKTTDCIVDKLIETVRNKLA